MSDRSSIVSVRYHEYGEPSVLQVDRVEPDPLGADKLQVEVVYAGINYIDTIQRSGTGKQTYGDSGYLADELPAVPGMEGAGIVRDTGEDVSEWNSGDRVAFWNAEGSYRTSLTLKSHQAVTVPDDVTLKTAASVLLNGLTADYLAETVTRPDEGDRVLVHAAGGGVGELLVQELTHRGCQVFGTCSSQSKASLVEKRGGEPIRYDRTDVPTAIESLSPGGEVDVALDSVGLETFRDSISVTATRGHVILYGQSSGEPRPIFPRKRLGSRTLTCPYLKDYVRTPEELRERSQRIFRKVERGSWERTIHEVFALREAGEAHRHLESRQSMGKILLSVSD
jgi:NADPH2:quinone reductase